MQATTIETAVLTEKAGEADPLVVSYGGGVDSTAMIVGLWRAGIRPDVILFANVASEWPETVDFLPIFDEWLASVGFPRLTVVRNKCPRVGHRSLEDNCLKNETLPGQAFRGGQPGGGNCSARWKHEPMDRWLRREKILSRRRAIGYDAGARDSKRAAKGSDESKKHKRDTFVYFLQTWGWDRERCSAEILAAGLPLPRKSSCFFCPAMRKEEIRDLARLHPNLLRRAIRMEQVARAGKHGLRTVQGLGRRFSWESYSREEKLLPEHGGAPDAEGTTEAPSPAAAAWLAAREVLV